MDGCTTPAAPHAAHYRTHRRLLPAGYACRTALPLPTHVTPRPARTLPHSCTPQNGYSAPHCRFTAPTPLRWICYRENAHTATDSPARMHTRCPIAPAAVTRTFAGYTAACAGSACRAYPARSAAHTAACCPRVRRRFTLPAPACRTVACLRALHLRATPLQRLPTRIIPVGTCRPGLVLHPAFPTRALPHPLAVYRRMPAAPHTTLYRRTGTACRMVLPTLPARLPPPYLRTPLPGCHPHLLPAACRAPRTPAAALHADSWFCYPTMPACLLPARSVVYCLPPAPMPAPYRPALYRLPPATCLPVAAFFLHLRAAPAACLPVHPTPPTPYRLPAPAATCHPDGPPHLAPHLHAHHLHPMPHTCPALLRVPTGPVDGCARPTPLHLHLPVPATTPRTPAPHPRAVPWLPRSGIPYLPRLPHPHCAPACYPYLALHRLRAGHIPAWFGYLPPWLRIFPLQNGRSRLHAPHTGGAHCLPACHRLPATHRMPTCGFCRFPLLHLPHLPAHTPQPVHTSPRMQNTVVDHLPPPLATAAPTIHTAPAAPCRALRPALLRLSAAAALACLCQLLPASRFTCRLPAAARHTVG